MIIEHNSHHAFYRSPFGACETGTIVTIRFLTSGERPPSRIVMHVEGTEYREDVEMNGAGEKIGHFVFERAIKAPDQPMVIWYWFEVLVDNKTIYYGNNPEARGGVGLSYDILPPVRYQITVYKKGYKTPDWFKEQVMYQIFPDRFYNGKADKSIHKKEGAILHGSWNEFPYYKAEQFGGTYLANDFFGGNLEGIRKKLDYLKELGISVIYLNPVFEAFSNHRYDTGDYETIDPVLGTNEDFQKLCIDAGKRGIRILLDGVFSHTGSDSVYFNKQGKYPSVGAYQSKESLYYNWYSFENYPEAYDCWWGIKTLPNVREMEESYRDFILHADHSVVRQWIKRGASGWRLDVADELPDTFIKELRSAVKAEDENAVIIGEVWEDASNKESYGVLREYFLGEELDGVMNYPFRDAAICFICGRIDGWDFNGRLMSQLENYPKEAMYATMNILGTHDVMRIRHAMAEVPDLDREGQAVYCLSSDQRKISRKRQMLAAALQMTFVGVPCVYYGDEVGMDGFEDPFNRQTFPWDYMDQDLLEFYKKVINVRNKTNVLKLGEIKPISIDKHMYSFVRYNIGGRDAFGNEAENDCVFVVINVDKTGNARVTCDLSEFRAVRATDLMSGEVLEMKDGTIQLEIEPLGFRIYRCES